MSGHQGLFQEEFFISASEISYQYFKISKISFGMIQAIRDFKTNISGHRGFPIEYFRPSGISYQQNFRPSGIS
jgi:hypothetical protein